MVDAIDLIRQERAKQAEQGWTPEKEDEYRDQELAYAAASFAGPEYLYSSRGRGWREVYKRVAKCLAR